MECAACKQPDAGLAHTCAGSGTFLAAEAYDADAVAELAEQWPRFDVAVQFQARAADEDMIRTKLTNLVTALLQDDLVEHSNFTIKELVT